MVKQIVRDIFFLGQPSTPATRADIQVGKDLQDTLQANREHCVGMAANMIGVKKNIIIVNMGFIDVGYTNKAIDLFVNRTITKSVRKIKSSSKRWSTKKNVICLLYTK